MNAGERRPGCASIVCAIAIFVSPFLALLFSVNAGLALMTIALFATAFLLREALAGAPETTHGLLRLLLIVNASLAAACAVAFVMLMRG